MPRINKLPQLCRIKSPKTPLHPLTSFFYQMWNISSRQGDKPKDIALRLLARYASLDPYTKDELISSAKARNANAKMKADVFKKLNAYQQEYRKFPIHPGLVDAICDFYIANKTLNAEGIQRVAALVLENLKDERYERHVMVARNYMASLFHRREKVTGKTLYIKLNMKRALNDMQEENIKGQKGLDKKAVSILTEEYNALREITKEYYDAEAGHVKELLKTRNINPVFETVFRVLLPRVYGRMHDANPHVRATKTLQLIHQYCKKEGLIV
mmetsp:Transcript_35/g.75  ORF Transcript_35/g.75 Transcript_35/m.75 type:complete len:271 (-) Transcript_35:128-940(-)